MDRVYIDKLPENHSKIDILKQLLKSSNTLEVEFIYASKFSNTKHLRDFVGVIGKLFGFPQKKTSRIILISDELNNNAIEYGTDNKGFNSLRVFVHIEDSSIQFIMEVEDNGKGQAAKTALDMETMRAHKLKRGYFNHDSIRGRGLFLITVQIADRLYFKNSSAGGLIVGVKLKMKKQ